MQTASDFDLTSHNTLGLKAIAETGAFIKSAQDVEAAVEMAESRGLPLRVLGGGSNVILQRRLSGIIGLMQIEGCDRLGTVDGDARVVAGAGMTWQHLVEWTLANDLPGLENLAGIPGTVGAAPVQNIGAYGVELAERFHDLVAYDLKQGKHRRFAPEDCDFTYRNSIFKRQPGRYIITEVTLNLPGSWKPVTGYQGLEELGDATPQQIMHRVLEIRGSKLPDWRQLGNAGSFFHNPVVTEEVAARLRARHADMPSHPLPGGQVKLSAAWLIERCGLKGERVGGAGVHLNHALVIVNHGNADQDDIAVLAERVREKVRDRFGILLTQEPEWI